MSLLPGPQSQDDVPQQSADALPVGAPPSAPAYCYVHRDCLVEGCWHEFALPLSDYWWSRSEGRLEDGATVVCPDCGATYEIREDGEWTSLHGHVDLTHLVPLECCHPRSEWKHCPQCLTAWSET